MLALSGVSGGDASGKSNAEPERPSQPGRTKTVRIGPEGGSRTEPGGSWRGPQQLERQGHGAISVASHTKKSMVNPVPENGLHGLKGKLETGWFKPAPR
jgi:hypothetical protein